MIEKLNPCECGAVNSEDEQPLIIQFATQAENSGLKHEGTILYIRCLNCGYIGPLVLCPNGISSKKLFAAWNARHESGELPGWLRIKIEEKLSGWRDYYRNRGMHPDYEGDEVKGLKWVLSLRKDD